MLCMYESTIFMHLYMRRNMCLYIVQDLQLYDAAKEGNLPEALVALDRGADVNWQTISNKYSFATYGRNEKIWVKSSYSIIIVVFKITI